MVRDSDSNLHWIYATGLIPHLYPHLLILLPSPRNGERRRKRDGIKQIHWDFESGTLRNVGKDEALRHW